MTLIWCLQYFHIFISNILRSDHEVHPNRVPWFPKSKQIFPKKNFDIRKIQLFILHSVPIKRWVCTRGLFNILFCVTQRHGRLICFLPLQSKTFSISKLQKLAQKSEKGYEKKEQPPHKPKAERFPFLVLFSYFVSGSPYSRVTCQKTRS